MVVADIDIDIASKTSAELNRARGRTMPHVVDVANERSVGALFDACENLRRKLAQSAGIAPDEAAAIKDDAI